MEVLEEQNPLRIEQEIEPSMKVARGFRNNVGRPARKNEILFSAPPKSMISLLLSEEKNKKLKVYQEPEISINQTENTQNSEEEGKKIKESHELQQISAEPAKKWTCEHCLERIFDKKSEFNKHLRSHREYKCDYPNCSYATKFTSNLKTHKRIHSSEYLYVCDECTFRTKFINSLKTHKRLHDTERPFQCQYCVYKCNSGSNLKKHYARKHTNIANNNDISAVVMKKKINS